MGTGKGVVGTEKGGGVSPDGEERRRMEEGTGVSTLKHKIIFKTSQQILNKSCSKLQDLFDFSALKLLPICLLTCRSSFVIVIVGLSLIFSEFAAVYATLRLLFNMLFAGVFILKITIIGGKVSIDSLLDYFAPAHKTKRR